ncbi:hypothetical protein DFH09DRAFT_979748 [Mycena vulgaris]|nr:hypothetical protein DFH09DRAFT_979748 [Mycena vulgaris]
MAPPLPISSSIVEDWFHGLYTAAMLVTLWVIWYRKQNGGSRRTVQLAMVIMPYICSTMHAALNWVWYSEAINENELPGGPGLLFSLTHLPAWLEGTGDSFFVLNIFMADCMLIWRCWCVWRRRWQVIVLPALATITGVVLGGIIISDQVIALRSLEPFVVVKKSHEFVRFSTIYFSLSVATSLTTTFLIALRILLVQHSSKKAGTGTYHDFNPVLEILIESALLYSVTLLTFVVLDVEKNINLYYAQNIHAQMVGLAPLLIILRIAAGQSRPEEEWSTSITGSLRFGRAVSDSTLETSDKIESEP